MILGIDVGGSTTKIAGYEGKTRVGLLQVRAEDQVTSLYGAIGHFLYENGQTLEQVERVVLTGVGASMVDGDVHGIPTCKVDEFRAIGAGGLALAGLEEALVVSMGTGTAYVRAGRAGMRHIGGSGMGGGTLLGLSKAIFAVHDFERLNAMALGGDVKAVDLTIGDITRSEIATLPLDVTAANFGKMKSTASQEDIAAGLMNMVFQNIGLLAAFACRGEELRDVVLTGTLTTIPVARGIFNEIEALYPVRFYIPEEAVFATAVGAVLCAEAAE
ncbi:MAG: pantothenate kinase [Clostridiales bacterium]|nr:pantothenate kinase [Clostridiales bacterium]